MASQEEKVQYINDNQDIPKVLDGALGSILEKKAGANREEVLKALAQYALKELTPATSAQVATSSVPNFALASQNAESLANYSSVAHNINQPIFGIPTAPIVATKMAPDSPEISEEEAYQRNKLHRRGTITKYNKKDLPPKKKKEEGHEEEKKDAFQAEEDAEAARLKLQNQHLIKTIATVGPSCSDVETLRAMIKAGMTVARLNLSHGTAESHEAAVKNIREAAAAEDAHVAIAVDTRGSEVRLGVSTKDGSTKKLKKGETLNLSTNPKYIEEPTDDTVFVDWEHIAEGHVTDGQRLCVADGLLTLFVRSVETDEDGKKFLACNIENDFELGNRKNVNLPGVVVDIPILNDSTKADFAFAAAHNIDIVFLSFVQTAEDVTVCRAFLEETGVKFPTIIAKIENQEGLKALDEILTASDGIMVARGDLGSELPIQKLFVVQKMMIAKANLAGKPVIVSSQLLDSMSTNTQPTRAEANDVANAVLDGADSLMLSGETATGAHPAIATQVMGDITFEAQRFKPRAQLFRSMVALQPRPMPDEEAIASSAVNSAMELGLKAIITLTTSGSSARSISKYHPPCPVIAICKTERAYNQLNLVRAVIPYRYEGVSSDDRNTRLDKGIEWAKDHLKLLNKGDMIALLHADIHGPATGYANVCRVVIVE